jgi:hypothetical protein
VDREARSLSAVFELCVGDPDAENLLGRPGPAMAPALQDGRAPNWLRGLSAVHGFAGLEPSWPRPLSCRARSPFVAGPDLRLVGHVPIVGASQYAFHARSVVLGSLTALDLRNGPESSCLRGPSGRLWIRALIPHSALSLNLALQSSRVFPWPDPSTPACKERDW